jgi:hypothetical protein
MRGDNVIVRAFGGLPLVRKVWSIGARVIYLTDDEEFQKLEAGKSALPPIGFPKEDVFAFDPAIVSNLESLKWSEAKPYLD